jgi:hypothetical protein
MAFTTATGGVKIPPVLFFTRGVCRTNPTE